MYQLIKAGISLLGWHCYCGFVTMKLVSFVDSSVTSELYINQSIPNSLSSADIQYVVSCAKK
jgi:hypothetical protein